MRPTSLIGVLLILISGSASANPDISMDISRFSAGSSAYIDVSIYIVGTSLAADSLSKGEYGIEYVLMVRDTQDRIVARNKYKLSRTGFPALDIFDVKRLALAPGNYRVEVEAVDLVDKLSQVTVSQDIVIPSNMSSAYLSDIQLAATLKTEPDGDSPFHKSGIYLEPIAFRFYYPALQQLCLYIETYHADSIEGQPYLQYTIRPMTGDVPPAITSYKKVRKESIAANVFQFDISHLISGPYVLEASLFDGNRQLKETKTLAFSRLNPEGDSLYAETAATTLESGFVHNISEDSLDYSLRAMAPIVNSLDNEILNTLIKKGSSNAKRYFIYKFWTTRSGKLAGTAYENYMAVARVVDVTFASGFGYGFETDRGHIFLKYGQPNDVVTVEDEPSAPPYEIWMYNTFPATHQTNVRFLFYNPSLTKNGFELLHSNARGEVNNSKWEVELYRDATLETPGVNENQMGDNVYRNARQYFQY